MTTTIRLTEKEANQIIADHLAAKGHHVESIKFICTDNYPSSKDYEGNWVQSVEATISAAPAPRGSDSTAFLSASGY